MASCLLTAGYGLPCRSVGGVSPAGVFIAEWQCPGPGSMQITVGTVSSPSGDLPGIPQYVATYGGITGFTGSTVSFYQFCQDIEIASLSETSVVSIENGTSYNEITLTFNVFNFGQDVQNIVTTLGAGRWRVIILGNDGNYYFMGYSNPVSITDGSGGINKALGDLNGYTFTMVGKEQFGILQVSPTAAASVLTYN